jgi:TRAP-type C4-dicarboxylate transport system substrate-binding protein
MTKFLRYLAIALFLHAIPAFSQEKFELKLSHFLPTTHVFHTQFAEAWAKELEAKSAGRLTVRIFPGTSSLGNPANQLDQLKAGVVDIAIGLHSLPRGRFPRTQIAEMPMLFENSYAASMSLWTLYPTKLRKDAGYQGLRVLALYAPSAGLIHTRDKKVATMEDFKGMRIRSPSVPVNDMLTFLGATPVALPAGQVYENLQKGVIDGAVFPWDPVGAYKLAEITKYHLDAKAYTSPFWIMMNERKYASLPADLRKLIDDTTGEKLVTRLSTDITATADRAGHESAKAKNNVITPLAASERERWGRTLVPMINKTLLDLEQQGITDAREIYIQMQRDNARFTPAGRRQ